MGSATPTSDIYETVRSEVQRAISSIQDDLENVSWLFLLRIYFVILSQLI